MCHWIQCTGQEATPFRITVELWYIQPLSVAVESEIAHRVGGNGDAAVDECLLNIKLDCRDLSREGCQ
jgi:hypothetical protein